jgi:predicted metal-dependent hydrolase
MKRTCHDSPPGQLLQGIREFNGQEWFECHETVEDLWIGAEGEARDFYQGIIQVAVALHHWRNGNFGGAVSLLKGGAGYLGHVADRCQWVDVAGLIDAADRVRTALEVLGKERMQDLDPALIPRIRTIPSGCGDDTSSISKS